MEDRHIVSRRWGALKINHIFRAPYAWALLKPEVFRSARLFLIWIRTQVRATLLRQIYHYIVEDSAIYPIFEILYLSG